MNDLSHITNEDIIEELCTRMKCMVLKCCFDNEDGAQYHSELVGTYHETSGLLHLLTIENDFKTKVAYGDRWLEDIDEDEDYE